MDINTQLGGPYRPENHALFEVKNKLASAGIYVRQPMGDDFIIDKHGKSFGFHPLSATLKQIELDLMRSIATCDLHFVCNELDKSKGHIGKNTASGMLYAILKNKPIVMLHKCIYAHNVDLQIKQILKSCESQFIIFDPRPHTSKTILMNILAARRRNPVYDLTPAQKTIVRGVTQKNIIDLI
jgi:hypothetical protein